MKTIYRIVLSALFAISLFSCQEETLDNVGFGTLTGIVVNAGDNTPVANVKITTNPVSTTVFTNEDGEFIFEKINTGDYSVQAIKNDFLASFEPAQVNIGRTVNVVFELEKSTSRNKAPTTPELISPQDGSEDVELTTQFIWSSKDPNDDVLTYSLELRNGSNNDILLIENLKDSTYTIENLKQATTYFWQVKVSDSINPTVQSAVSSFKTIEQNRNRFLYVREINGKNVIYSGSDSSGSTEEVNENEFPLTTSSNNSYRPRRSVQSNMIAFLRTLGTETHLFTMNNDGSNQKQITSTNPVAGFRQNEVDFTWYDNGEKLLYPQFNKLYSINNSGTGNQVVYEAPSGTFITEVVANDGSDLVVIKTNDANGYNAKILLVNISTHQLERIVIENVEGALGGLDYSVDGKKILYTRDVSGFENENYRRLNSKIYEYYFESNESLEVKTGKATGFNDLDPKYSPNEGAIIFTRTSNDGISEKDIYVHYIDSNTISELLFTNASMADWK
jgi:hypothetical protein